MKLKQFLPIFCCLTLFTSGWLANAADALPPLRVGITANLPPMAFKQDGQIVGIEADFAKLLGQELGREVKFVEVAWEDQIPTLLDGKTDIIMSGMTITKPRQFRVTFCSPYLRSGQMALIRGEDMQKFALAFPIPPPGVIGVEKSTTGDFLVQQEFPRSKRKTFSGGEAAAKALKKKQIDLYISDATTIWWLASENEAEGLAAVPIQLTDEQIAWAVSKTNSDLLDAANKALAKWQQSGKANKIVKHWLPNFQ
ncbi:MAG TPA: transporter substrate-binding domain-containing protein [Verrucomicrobiae bacterium]|jgi:polar amino acid transport system substrate-binding protein